MSILSLMKFGKLPQHKFPNEFELEFWKADFISQMTKAGEVHGSPPGGVGKHGTVQAPETMLRPKECWIATPRHLCQAAEMPLE